MHYVVPQEVILRLNCKSLTLAVDMYQNDIKAIMGRAFQVGGNI